MAKDQKEWKPVLGGSQKKNKIVRTAGFGS
jgi:hypothetical protein